MKEYNATFSGPINYTAYNFSKKKKVALHGPGTTKVLRFDRNSYSVYIEYDRFRTHLTKRGGMGWGQDVIDLRDSMDLVKSDTVILNNLISDWRIQNYAEEEIARAVLEGQATITRAGSSLPEKKVRSWNFSTKNTVGCISTGKFILSLSDTVLFIRHESLVMPRRAN